MAEVDGVEAQPRRRPRRLLGDAYVFPIGLEESSEKKGLNQRIIELKKEGIGTKMKIGERENRN